MKVVSTLYIALGVFALAAGAVYGLWGHEPAGTLYLVVLSVAFAYLARESREYGAEPSDDPQGGDPLEPAPGSTEAPTAKPVTFHASAPTLTPFLFALTIGIVMGGLVFSQWLVIAGGWGLALVAIAWFYETGLRRKAEEAAKAGHH